MVSVSLSNVLKVVRKCKISLFSVFFVAIALSISYQLWIFGDKRRGNSICWMVGFRVGCGLVCLGVGFSLDLQSC